MNHPHAMEQSSNHDRAFGPTGRESENRMARPRWKRWNPLWGWAVFGAIVIATMLLGMFFGGDGGYS